MRLGRGAPRIRSRIMEHRREGLVGKCAFPDYRQHDAPARRRTRNIELASKARGYTTCHRCSAKDEQFTSGGVPMPDPIVNYDGSITASPQQIAYPETVEEIQSILRDPAHYPSPVRAVGSYHSLTP